MPTISYERPVTINPDWGVRNLIKAIDRGPAFAYMDEEYLRKYEEEHCAPLRGADPQAEGEVLRTDS